MDWRGIEASLKDRIFIRVYLTAYGDLQFDRSVRQSEMHPFSLA
jgi:hypothetical protein